MSEQTVVQAYEAARERYAELGVDTEAALKRLAEISISLHCWQADDVVGFEQTGEQLGAGLAVTGGYPGRARNGDELRLDYEKAFSLIPGKHRVNLHACYLETDGRRVDRDQIEPRHFERWMDWAAAHGLGMDFNPTFFAHPNAASGMTLAHPDPGIRRFWIAHGMACRRIGAAMGRRVGSPCVTNVWIPDGQKDTPIDRLGPRRLLAESLDAIFSESIDPHYNLDAVESKLFGIGSESYVVGSHEFYLGYAITRRKLLCLDTGHFHPTELVSDKVSSVLLFLPELLLHLSRGVRWDSDHVVVLSDEVLAIMQQIVRGGFLDRVHIALDFFDASINRVAAWVIGMRATLKALLAALLEPVERLQRLEQAGDYTARLAMLEELKTLPLGAVWDAYCLREDVPIAGKWLEDVRRYEAEVLSKR